MNEHEIKEMVKQKYNDLALAGRETEGGCCCRKKQIYTIMSDRYQQLPGYHPDADLGLGCGLPTAFAQIHSGDTVIDLGSGAGNDCFVARAETGPEGRVIGIDFSPAMVAKARNNAQNRGLDNVSFIQSDIEHTPLPDQTADVIISNCVLNLVPNKQAVFAEIYRLLKPGGHFSISDIVLTGELPARMKTAAEMYAGCVASAIQKETYLNYIRQAGFTALTIQREKPIIVPEEILSQHLTPEECADYQSRPTVIFSLSVYGQRPL